MQSLSNSLQKRAICSALFSSPVRTHDHDVGVELLGPSDQLGRQTVHLGGVAAEIPDGEVVAGTSALALIDVQDPIPEGVLRDLQVDVEDPAAGALAAQPGPALGDRDSQLGEQHRFAGF